MTGWIDKVLKPMNDAGVDFWWIDWQQWPYDAKVQGLSNTWWINYVFFSNMERKFNARPLLYHRWGGLGNHRYQIGFSGDSYITWASLDFQPYFNSTASNVLYGYWSHDIGGHMGATSIDPELFTRWMQFGTFSPIMRTHSTKYGGLNKEPWAFNDVYFNILRSTILKRYQIAPYTYSMARKAYDDGVSICRPMYYDYPESPEAYNFRNEYMYGDNMLIAPITAPMNNDYSTIKVWLPAGNDWYEWATGTLLKGGQIVERRFMIDEYPVYVKAGSILPFYDNVKNLRNNDEEIRVTVFPGNDGNFNMYEDNGNDKDYSINYATTFLKSEKIGNVQIVTIAKRNGKYKDMPAVRKFKIDMPGALYPEKVTMNGRDVDFSYDGNKLMLTINIPETDCDKEKIVSVIFPSTQLDINDGLIGKFNRVQKAVSRFKFLGSPVEGVSKMESAGINITYSPEKLENIVTSFNAEYSNLMEIMTEKKIIPDFQKWFINAIDWNK